MFSGPMSRTTSRPVRRGICTSRNTRSGLSVRMASMAASPLSAKPAISTPSSCRSRSSTRWRPKASSSTMRTRRFGPVIATDFLGGGGYCGSAQIILGVIGERDFGDETTALGVAQGEALNGTVERPQPRPGIAQSQTVGRGRLLEADFGAVVAHADDHTLARTLRGHFDV